MKWNEEQECFYFESTHRTQYANCGIVGINPDLRTSEGYDGSFVNDEDLSAEERAELADYMIGLWTRYKEEEKR